MSGFQNVLIMIRSTSRKIRDASFRNHRECPDDSKHLKESIKKDK